jgi:hypothetical protein
MPVLIVAYARLLLEFQEYAARRVGLDGDRVTLRIAPESEADVPRAMNEALGFAHRVAESRSLDELANIADLLRSVAPRSLEDGWSVVVDG